MISSRKHEMAPVKHQQRFNRAGENTKKTKKFRGFVIKKTQCPNLLKKQLIA